MTERTCVVAECDGPSYCQKMCPAHYQRWRKHGDPLIGGDVVRKTSKSTDLCAVEQCGRNVKSMRYCMTHYWRWKRHGDPLYEPPTMTVSERFWSKVTPAPADDCWLWHGGLDGPYGFFVLGRANKVMAHRWSYEHLVSEIPEGLELDHLCRVTQCVNPWHLEPVTREENLRREWEARRRIGA